jgi:hypothetical protein
VRALAAGVAQALESPLISLELNLHRLMARIFLLHGRRPYAWGCGSYRRIRLREHLSKKLPEGGFPAGWGLWLDERAVEYPWFFSRLPHATGRLLDAGSVLNYHYILSHEGLRNKSISIFTFAPESENYCHRGISYSYGDLRDCCYRDDYFDYIVCISTLEHVGMNNAIFCNNDASKNEYNPQSHLQALRELRRILKCKGVLFLTLPFGRAQMLGWLQIFDIGMVRRLLDVFGATAARETYFRYTDRGWQGSSAEDCADAGYFDPSQRGTVKTKIAAAEAVVCLELVK